MFQFPAFASGTAGYRSPLRWVAPFGHPRITGHLPLPAAFRSLSRPSSPPRAKASPMRPSLTPLFLTRKKSLLVVFAYASCRKSSALPPDAPEGSGRPAFLSEVFALVTLCFLRHPCIVTWGASSMSMSSSLAEGEGSVLSAPVFSGSPWQS